jgi:membrane protease YdiL (CAAX protease family)
MVGGTLVCALVTPVALVGWVLLLRPDLGDLTEAVGPFPFWLLVLGGLLFAVVNALGEEWVFRGVFQPRLAELFGPTTAILVQAASFGLAHTWGVPRGPVGALLAATWAIMLGFLRHHTQGLLAVVLAHIVADATIALIVVSLT